MRNSAQHEILGMQQFRPQDFANNIALNLDNSWGVLRVVCEFLLKQEPGKYLLMKDPLQQVVRVYSLPSSTFDSSDEDEDEEDDEDEDN